MVKRKCGTCRYFRDAGIACSGWCTHPERGDLHDLVLVRREELACRNSWDQDLWQPSPVPVEARSSAPGPIIPPPPDADAHTGQTPVPENPTDRVTSITISQAKRTREQYLPPAVTGGQPGASAGLVMEPEAARRLETIATLPGKQHGVSALEPSFKRAVRSGASQRRAENVRRGDPALRGERSAVGRGQSANPEPSEHRRRASARREERAGVRPELSSDTSPLPVDQVNRLFAVAREREHRELPSQEPASSGPAARSLDEALRESEHAGRRQLAREPEQRPGDTQAFVHTEMGGLTTSTQSERFTEPPAAPPVSAPWPIDERGWVRGIPRCCETCREFQRDTDGRTGRCGSPYALTQGAVVECDQLACRSSVGIWWLPSDDFWLEQSDISHHTRPTPYLDAILAKKTGRR